MKRSSGVLMPMFSLPSNTGIGNFGKYAYKFIDLLKEAKQNYWQLLPLNPIDSSNSPYFSISHFAGCTLFIDLESLVDEGFLDQCDILGFDFADNKNKVNYAFVKQRYEVALKKAYNRFSKSNYNKVLLNAFKLKYGAYIKDYVIFTSMKTIFDKAFVEWDNEYKFYNNDAIDRFKIEHKELVEYNYFLQYLFFNQWLKLKKYANSSGIKIIGDMPIYSSTDSSDVWANAINFLLDEELLPIEIAGCPPDAFNDNGQVWGNPLYNYDYMKQHNYDYMMKKFNLLFKLYDVIRVDHFRGFESYYAIKAGSTDAKNGCWEKGPGIDLFNTLHKKINNANIIAEDLGFITDEVKKLLYDTGYPGMKVMQFAFSHFDDQNNQYRPHNYPDNCVAYLGTHDNDTFVGWYNNLCVEDKNIFERYIHEKVDSISKNVMADSFSEYVGAKDRSAISDITYATLQVLYNSKANLVITNIQDVLGLGTEARINTPSTLSENNWSFRFTEEQLFSDKVVELLTKLTIDSKRII